MPDILDVLYATTNSPHINVVYLRTIHRLSNDLCCLPFHFHISVIAVHLSDVFGLFLLCIVAVGQYNIKDHTHMQNQKDMKDGLHGHTSPNPSITGRSASHANLSHAAEDKRSSDHIL
jgi:hypothetical protein